MSLADDIAATFDDDTFGVVATIGGARVNGIFDDSYISPFGEVEANAAGFTCSAADVATTTHGAAVTIGGANYKVGAIERQHGIATMRLVKA